MSVTRRLRRLACWFGALWLALNGVLLYRLEAVPPSPTGSLRARVRAYQEHPEREAFDLIFVGDSRTYCGMHPDLMDPLLDTRSLNLARWANWFPTQYPLLADLLPSLPAGTRVVWSLGHANFAPVFQEVNTAYRIGAKNLPRYLSWGYRFADLRQNLLFYLPLTQVVGRGRQWRGQIQDLLERPLFPPPAPQADPSAGPAKAPQGATPEAREAKLSPLERWRRDPAVAEVIPRYESGRVASLEVLKRRGAYLRVELEPAFFRAKQAEGRRRALKAGAPQAPVHPAYWATFQAICGLLEEARERGVVVVVNEVEEAPSTYGSEAYREVFRTLMRERVQPEVERRGLPYLRVDWDRFSDADYFDHNHLNQRGVQRLAPLLAEQLRPHLGER